MHLFFIFIAGLLIGSFLNVVILRLPIGQKIGMDRSKCPRCGKILCWFELLPLVSFLIQAGRCRGCRVKISWQYPVVELLTGVLFIFSFYNYFLGVENLAQAFLKVIAGIAFLIIFVVDLKFGVVLDAVVWPAIVIIFLLNIMCGASWADLLLGAFIAGGFFAAQFLVSKGRWIGSGDIEIGVLMGVLLGWKITLVALFLAYVGGAIISVCLLCLKKKGLKSALPFGTFLAPASFVAMVWGERIIRWYLDILNGILFL